MCLDFELLTSKLETFRYLSDFKILDFFMNKFDLKSS